MNLKRSIDIVCGALSLALAGLAIVCLINPHRAQLYLADIFTLPALTATFGLAIVLWAARLPIARWAATAAAALFVMAIWPQAFPKQAAADPTQKPVRVVFGNMLIRNDHPEKIVPWLDKENPDVIAMVEVNPRAREAMMATLQSTRPYVVTRYDMVVASRWPIADVRRGGVGFALINLTIKAPGGDFDLAVAHLTRPWPYSSPADQPRQFARLSNAVKPVSGKRFVLVGDFNTPPCASGLRDFMRPLALHAAPAFFGTWPSPAPGLLRINIDNAMASPDLIFRRRQTGPFDGSDHRPIVVDVYPAKP